MKKRKHKYPEKRQVIACVLGRGHNITTLIELAEFEKAALDFSAMDTLALAARAKMIC